MLDSYKEFVTPKPLITTVPLRKDRPTGGRGYLVVDNRASGGSLIECHTFTCCHCNSVVAIHPNQKFPDCPFPQCQNYCKGMRKSARATCKKCNAMVCDDKLCVTECNSIMRSLDKMMARPYDPIPWLPRGYNGELLFDRSLLEAGKVY